MFSVRIHLPWLLMLVRKLYKYYICILNSFILGDSYVIVHRQMEEPKKSRGGRYIFEGNIINTREWWKQKYWKWKCFPFSSSNSSLFIVYYLYTSFFSWLGWIWRGDVIKFLWWMESSFILMSRILFGFVSIDWKYNKMSDNKTRD